jgi:hypothetical protein
MGSAICPGVAPVKANVQLRRIYANSIVAQPMILAGTVSEARIVAASQIASDLEYGKGPWDMKPMLLNGPKAKVSKKGIKYNIIPFRHGTPNDTGADSNFKQMPEDIYSRARKLKPTITPRNAQGLPTGTTKWGQRLTGTEVDYPQGHNPTTKTPHKSGIYEGMVKIQKTYRAATQSKYLTFRIVSAKSRPGSWWHPGYEPHRIANGIAAHCTPQVEAMVAAAASDSVVDHLTKQNILVGMTVTRL